MSDEITVHAFYEYLAGGKLMASYCAESDALYLPPRAVCPKTHSTEMEWREVSGKGKLAAFTAVYIGPTFMNEQGFDRTNPYVTGVVELDEGVMISARITGVDAANPESIEIGTPLTLDIQTLGEGDAAKPMLAFRAG